MIDKFVKCRVEHTCGTCKRVIKPKEIANYISFKTSRIKTEGFKETQIGIEYVTFYICESCEEDIRRESDMYNFDDD